MNQDQIAKEYHKLLVEQMKNLVENECFLRFEIELNKRIRSLADELNANKDVETSSKEEQYLHDVMGMQKIYQIDAHNELLAGIKRSAEKSTRRMNEIRKKIEQFCKRHGLNEDGTKKAEWSETNTLNLLLWTTTNWI